MIQRTQQCAAGDGLAKPKDLPMKDNSMKALADEIEAMICAAQA
jgi:hypothetical protein